MADNQYKIRLGVELDTSDILSEINKAEGKVDPIKIKVDAETKELATTIQNALKSLSTGGKNKLTLDTTTLEGSLKDVKNAVIDIKNAFGTLDDKSGMKSLLSSVNQISSALDKTSKKVEELVGDLKSLSGKDFSLNFGINLGGSNSVARQGIYGSHVRKETLPELKKQAEALQNYFKEYYNVQDELSAIMKLAPNRGGDIVDLYSPMSGYKSKTEKESLSRQMGAYREYINIIKEAAALRGIDISHITSGFSKSADQLIQDAQDIQTGAKEVDESFNKLKEIFGGGGNLNIEGLATQLEPIIKDLTAIRESVENLSKGVTLEGLTQSFDRLSDTLEQLMTNAKLVQEVLGGKMVVADANTGEVKEVENDLKQVTISAEKAENEINELKNALKRIDTNGDTSSIKKEMESLGLTVQKVTKTLNDDGSFSLKVTGVKELNNGLEQTITLVQRFNNEGMPQGSTQTFIDDIKKANNELLKLKNTADGLASSASMAKVGNQYNAVESDLRKLSVVTSQTRSSFENLTSTYTTLTSAQQNYNNIMSQSNATDEQKIDAMNRLIAANEQYQNTLATIKNLLAEQSRVERDANNTSNLEQEKKNFALQMQIWLSQNTAAAKQFGDRIEVIQSQLKSCNSQQLDGLKGEFREITQEAKLAGKTGQTFLNGLKGQFSKYSQYFSVASLFMYVEQGLRSMFEQVKLIDSAMTELKKVTNETDAAYNEFLKNAATRSREIGTTIDGLVSSTADFARLGYGFEDAQGLAEVANIYAVVGDEIEGVEGATESLISTMAAFKNEMNGMSNTDFAMSIIDKFNEIGNNFAISSGGIGEAMERSASSLMAANNTIDESIALITAANTVVQSPEQVGNAFKTISMRIKIHCPQ